MNLRKFGFSSPINVPTIEVLTNDTPFAIGTAREISKKKKKNGLRTSILLSIY